MEHSKEFHPSQSRFNDGTSSLSDFVQGQPRNLPGDATNQQGASAQRTVTATAVSRRHTAALQSGAIRGEEHYTEHTDAAAGQGHGAESDEQVESRMISKEEFPQG